MRAIVFVAVACLTVSCSKGPDAEDQFNIVQRSGSPQEICAAAERTRDAFLADKQEAKFTQWRDKAKEACNVAKLDSYGKGK